MCAPPPFVRLLQPPADAQPTTMDTDDATAVEAAAAVPTLTDISFASLRLLRALPNLRHVWDCTPLLALLSHEVSEAVVFTSVPSISVRRFPFPPRAFGLTHHTLNATSTDPLTVCRLRRCDGRRWRARWCCSL
jgi:hypothetical protein